jgi:Mn-dependent DtxR family transcriptional regulator
MLGDMETFRTVRGYQLIQQDKKSLTSAMEDYIEMIYRNSLETGLLRANMLSNLLNVHPSSVTKMLQKLSKLGYVDYQKYGLIFLTQKGRCAGEFLYHRHNTIQRFLNLINNNENSLSETELIEHHISSATLTSIELFLEFIGGNPDIIERFLAYIACITEMQQ